MTSPEFPKVADGLYWRVEDGLFEDEVFPPSGAKYKVHTQGVAVKLMQSVTLREERKLNFLLFKKTIPAKKNDYMVWGLRYMLKHAQKGDSEGRPVVTPEGLVRAAEEVLVEYDRRNRKANYDLENTYRYVGNYPPKVLS